jgi:hypothetical protein
MKIQTMLGRVSSSLALTTGSLLVMGSIIHLGAVVGNPACALNEELTVEVNLAATRMTAGLP